LFGKPKEKGTLRIHSPRCENNITIAITNVISEDVNSK